MIMKLCCSVNVHNRTRSHHISLRKIEMKLLSVFSCQISPGLNVLIVEPDHGLLMYECGQFIGSN